MKKNVLLLILIILKIQVQAQENDSIVTINVSTAKTYQTIRSISGNYCQARYTDRAQDEIGIFTLKTLSPQYVRIALPIRKWEPENDNDQPNSMNLARFNYADPITGLFGLLQEMKEQYGVINFTASVWDGPEWMIANPEQSAQRKISPDMYREAAESIGAFLYVAKNDYGVEADYFSFNEATGGYQIIFSPEEIINFIQVAGPHFRRLGLKTKFLVADAHNPQTLYEYAKVLLEEPSIQSYLGPVSYHSWWAENLSNDVLINIAQLAHQHDKEVWCAELGYDAMLYKNKDMYPTWDNGFRLAKISHRVLKFSQATVLQYWTFQNNFPLGQNQDELYPAYYVIKQFNDYLPPDSRLVESESSDPAIWSMAATGDDQYFMVQVINNDDSPREIEITNIPASSLFWIKTDQQNNMVLEKEIPVNERSIRLVLPKQSLNTFTSEVIE
ncbi:MAG: hypothetical protein ACNS62_05750 [Candidatus Cyclobacteriaceae bacterium M3_2C_046]